MESLPGVFADNQPLGQLTQVRPGRSSSNRRRLRRNVLVSLLAPLLAGCGYHPPGRAWTYPTTNVTGKIMLAGRAVPAGWVTLMPIDRTVGDFCIGRIHQDGTFTIPEAPIGPLQVRVKLAPRLSLALPIGQSAIYRKLASLSDPGSVLRLTTVAGKTDYFECDLLVAAMQNDADT